MIRRINPELPEMLARKGYTLRGFCREFHMSYSTIHAALHPEDYTDRIGGVRGTTAWRVARAWAAVTGQSGADGEEAAYGEVIIEEENTDDPAPSPPNRASHAT